MFEPLSPGFRSLSHGRTDTGFGHSDWQTPRNRYTFDHYAEIMNHFTEALGSHVLALHAGLRRPVGSHGVSPSDNRCPHCSGRSGAQ